MPPLSVSLLAVILRGSLLSLLSLSH
uniref:Uncharacterized protein n=1 Tax=Nelumbo nucifera TaxID=4432 RepID=A0A823A0V4_NELNU|nr:TPA_asm: hypothetical protein HUJ06_019132 [Nelumbo nucifera]